MSAGAVDSATAIPTPSRRPAAAAQYLSNGQLQHQKPPSPILARLLAIGGCSTAAAHRGSCARIRPPQSSPARDYQPGLPAVASWQRYSGPIAAVRHLQITRASDPSSTTRHCFGRVSPSLFAPGRRGNYSSARPPSVNPLLPLAGRPGRPRPAAAPCAVRRAARPAPSSSNLQTSFQFPSSINHVTAATSRRAGPPQPSRKVASRAETTPPPASHGPACHPLGQLARKAAPKPLMQHQPTPKNPCPGAQSSAAPCSTLK